LNVAGINVYAFRMLILVMAAFSTPLTSASGWWFDKLARRAMLLGALWLLFGLLSLLWTPNESGGMTDLASIGFGFALLLVLFNLRAYESHNLQLLRMGWSIAFLVTTAVAIWELATGQHLDSAMFLDRPYYFDGTVVQSTLVRPDFYGQFLLAVTPFLLWSFYGAKGPMKLIYAGFVATAGILVLFTASRLTFMGFAAEVLFLVFLFDRRWYVMMLGLVGAVAGYFWFTQAFLSSDLHIAAKFEQALSDRQQSNSITTRFALTVNGLWMVYDTAGRGVGAAGFPAALVDRDVPLRIAGLGPEGYSAHNLWVQIASEYGILPMVGFLVLFVFIARLALQAGRKPPGTPPELRTLGIITMVGLVGYVFYGAVSGDPLRHSVHWMFFATLVVVAVHLHKAKVASSVARMASHRRPVGAEVLTAPGRRLGDREASALPRASS
jgi:O-antigen ligase